MSKRSKLPTRQKAGPFAAGLDALSDWFERNRRVLPWRDDPSLYRVWVSEIMLQQTQVVTVVPYFERFLARFPTVEALAVAPASDVMAHWAGLGYYSRARNLHKAAQQIVAAGGFPRDREGWLEIPGVGGYTAGAILSIALGQSEAILDGNVERVLSRLRRVSRVGRSAAFVRSGDAAYKARLWRLSRAVVVRAHERGLRPSVINQALMELGATTCTPRKPTCLLCPLQGLCRAFKAGEQEAYPPRKKRKEWLSVKEELHCLVDDRGRVLLRQRLEGEWRAGLWDLLSDVPYDGAEKLGEVETRYVVTRHKVTRKTVVWRVSDELKERELEMPTRILRAAEPDTGEAALQWVSVSRPEVAVGSALSKTLKAVRERFEELG